MVGSDHLHQRGGRHAAVPIGKAPCTAGWYNQGAVQLRMQAEAVNCCKGLDAVSAWRSATSARIFHSITR
jgi:hypothetical protein